MSELTALNLLLKATSKSAVEKIFNVVFVSRADGNSRESVEFVKEALSLESIDEAEELRKAILKCLQVTMASGAIEDLAELFKSKGQDINAKLKSLIGQVVNARLESWRDSAALNRVALPRLVDVDWALHVKRASSQVSQMQVPVIQVSLQVESQPESTEHLPETNRVDFELSKEVLETMLDGLGKIRDQLASMG